MGPNGAGGKREHESVKKTRNKKNAKRQKKNTKK